MNPRALVRPRFLAFTLIELITVIAIIAILMALLFSALWKSKETALRAKAGNAVRAIVNSCKNYASDYGKFPPVPGASNAGTGGSSGQNSILSFGDTQNGRCQVKNSELFDVLRAIDRGANAQHALNKRQQSYFSGDRATVDPRNPRDGFADGKDFPTEIQGQYLDPWGVQYCVVLDGDNDGKLRLDSFFSDQTDEMLLSAAAFSMAPNGEIGGKGYQGRLRKQNSTEPPDDIISW